MIVSMSRKSAAVYRELAPDLFRIPDEEGFEEFLADDTALLANPTNLALVAEIDDQVVGYLEPSTQKPSGSSRWHQDEALDWCRGVRLSRTCAVVSRSSWSARLSCRSGNAGGLQAKQRQV